MMKLKLAALACLISVTGLGETKESAQTEPVVRQNVVMTLDGQIRETPPEIDLGLPDLKTNLFWDQLRLVRMAAEDDDVVALTVLINQPRISLAQCQQLLAELKRFKKTGKKVFVHADSVSMGTYLLALPADEIAMTPGASLWLEGLRLRIFYYKGLMDKLGIEADTEHLGQFKLAAEPFTDLEPSEEMVQQLNDLVDDVYDQVVTEIAQARKLSAKAVRAIIDRGPYLAEQAREAKLIDQVAHRSDFLKLVAKSTHAAAVYDYARAKMPTLKSGWAGLLQMFSLFGAKGAKGAANKIAIVFVNGMLIEGESEELFDSDGVAGSQTLRKAFQAISKDRSIKAVVVRIDSPGGSSTASEIIWKQVAAAARKKPVAVSMNGTAASGGYYVACAGGHVFAAPATLTGSIGVIAGKPVLTELLAKIGVREFAVTRGENAGLFDPFSKFSDHQRQTVRQHLEQVYANFKARVKEGRGEKIKDVSALATGRVFTGRQAVDLGLVDQIGTLADAVEWAAEKAGVTSYEVVLLPKPKTLVEILLEGLGYKMDSEQAQMTANLIPWIRPENMAPVPVRALWARVAMIGRIFQQADLLALSPVHLEVR